MAGNLEMNGCDIYILYDIDRYEIKLRGSHCQLKLRLLESRKFGSSQCLTKAKKVHKRLWRTCYPEKTSQHSVCSSICGSKEQ